PLSRAPPAELAADQGVEADGDRRRVLARRRAQQATHADLRHRLLLEGGPRCVPRARRGRAAPRPSAPGPAARPLPLRGGLARRGAVASEGNGDLERAGGPAARGERATRI